MQQQPTTTVIPLQTQRRSQPPSSLVTPTGSCLQGPNDPLYKNQALQGVFVRDEFSIETSFGLRET